MIKIKNLKYLGLAGSLAFLLNSCAEPIEEVVNASEDVNNECKSTFLRVQMPPDGGPIDLSQAELICLNYDPFKPICRDDILAGNVHSHVYENYEETCSLRGRTEDEFYNGLGVAARDVARGPFLQNNPLNYLRSLEPISFYGETSGDNYFSLNWISIRPKEDTISYYEIVNGSEFVDRDFVAADEYIRFLTYSEEGIGAEQVGSISLVVSRLTARGECNIAGLLSDIAKQTAISIYDPFSSVEEMTVFNYDPDHGTRLTYSVRWVEQENGNYIFLSEDRAAWISNQYLIEIFFPNNAVKPQLQDFTNPLIIDLLHSAYPSSISKREYDHMVAGINTFRFHRQDLLDNECIPPEELPEPYSEIPESSIY